MRQARYNQPACHLEHKFPFIRGIVTRSLALDPEVILLCSQRGHALLCLDVLEPGYNKNRANCARMPRPGLCPSWVPVQYESVVVGVTRVVPDRVPGLVLVLKEQCAVRTSSVALKVRFSATLIGSRLQGFPPL